MPRVDTKASSRPTTMAIPTSWVALSQDLMKRLTKKMSAIVSLELRPLWPHLPIVARSRPPLRSQMPLHSKCITVYNDNKAAVDWAASVTLKSTKHINLHENCVSENHKPVLSKSPTSPVLLTPTFYSPRRLRIPFISAAAAIPSWSPSPILCVLVTVFPNTCQLAKIYPTTVSVVVLHLSNMVLACPRMVSLISSLVLFQFCGTEKSDQRSNFYY